MSGNFAWQRNRLLIPRWRLFANTSGSFELASPKKPESREPKSAELLRRINQWEIEPSLTSAAELVESSIVEGYEDDALDAARRLVQVEKSATHTIRIQAYELLKRHKINIEFAGHPVSNFEEISVSIRDSMRTNVRDSLAWLDLAYVQTNEGHLEKANRSMMVALNLAPENRFVIRSASRFLLHRGQPDDARDLLLRSAGIFHDPWLMSAEISISEIVGKGSRTAKAGSRLIEEGNFDHSHTTELASALATLEMGGNRKKMRRLFKHSLLAPSGNSLAQATWASPLVNIDLVSTAIQVKGEHEAPAHQYYTNGMFDLALDNGKLWVLDEPFAIRPIEFTAGAASLVEKFDVAIKYADKGLKRSPKSNQLLLSKSFALGSTGDTKSASELLKRVDRKAENGIFGYFANANEGLIAFREGRLDDAKKLYQYAIRGFGLLRDANSVATAQCYMARESFRAGDPHADTFLKEAEESVKKVQNSKIAWYALNLVLADRG